MHAQRATRAPSGPSPRSDIARQRGPLGPETSICACLMSSKQEMYQISIKWTDLCSTNSFSHGFSGCPRCNPWKQTDHISVQNKRQLKRTH